MSFDGSPVEERHRRRSSAPHAELAEQLDRLGGESDEDADASFTADLASESNESLVITDQASYRQQMALAIKDLRRDWKKMFKPKGGLDVDEPTRERAHSFGGDGDRDIVQNVTLRSMQAQLAHLTDQLASKTEALKLAGEMGQMLLSKVESSTEHLADLEERMERSTEREESLRAERKTLQRSERELKERLSRARLENEEREEELKKLRKKLASAETATPGVSEEKETQIEALHNENVELRSALADLKSKYEDAKGEMETMAYDTARHRERSERIPELESQVRALESRLDKLSGVQARTLELEKENKHLLLEGRKFNEWYDMMKKDAEDMQRKLDEKDELLQMLRRKLDQNHILIEPSLLSQLQNQSKELAKVAEEVAVAPSFQPNKAPSHIRESSLAAQGAQSMGDYSDSDDSGGDDSDDASDGGAAAAAATAATAAAAPGGPGTAGAASGVGGVGTETPTKKRGRGLTKKRNLERTPSAQNPLAGGPIDEEDEHNEPEDIKDREFFTLTAVAIKINRTDLMDGLETISTKKLYGKARRKRIPMHLYHSWLNRELTQAYIERLYSDDQYEAANERSDNPAPSGDTITTAKDFRSRRTTAVEQLEKGKAIADAQNTDARRARYSRVFKPGQGSSAQRSKSTGRLTHKKKKKGPLSKIKSWWKNRS